MNISPLLKSSPGDQQSVEMTLQERDRLYSQRNQLEAEIHALQSGNIIDNVPDVELPKLYGKLQQGVLLRSFIHYSQDVIMKREHRLSVLKGVSDGKASQQQVEDMSFRELVMLLDEYADLALQVEKEQKEVAVMKKDLEKIKAENVGLLEKSRQLFSKIGEKKLEREEELKQLTTGSDGKSIHDKLQTKLQLNVIQNNTFQGLILGSGIQWTQDENLNKFMLDAGQNVHV